jgi:hydroxymethylpyrimidine kinase/phosphomethylpyrimidine kinase/thiamine-phosphate diphosphorylase
MAGLDATGAAGMLADVAAIHACCAPTTTISSLITALTVQSDQAVFDVVATAPALLEAQLTQVLQTGPIRVLKVGMLATEAQWMWLTSVLQRWSALDSEASERFKTAYSRIALSANSALASSELASSAVAGSSVTTMQQAADGSPTEPLGTQGSPAAAARPWVILDPVIFASSGGQLAQVEPAMVRQLLPYIDLLTPNLPELAWLCRGLLPSDSEAMDSDDPRFQQQLQALHQAGAGAIYVKGGHVKGGIVQSSHVKSSHVKAGHAQPHGYIDDVLSLATPPDALGAPTQWRFRSMAVLKHENRADSTRFDMRGTGCRLASAMAAYLHQGYDLLDALTLARAYLQQQLWQAARPSLTPAAMPQGFTPTVAAGLLPDVTPLATFLPQPQLYTQPQPQPQPHAQPHSALAAGFPALQGPIGLYAVVDSVQWLAKLLPLGIPTLQLRIKDTDTAAVRRAIAAAVALSRDYPSQLFINDHWQLAIEAGAYGVHLGQEDLASADLSAIAAAGLRLGISTHGYAEISRVLALRPSYIALGHVFPTTTKQMPSAPQGLERLAAYVKLCQPTPTVAIGGIDVQNIDAVLATGVDGVAVVRAITTATDPVVATQQLMQHIALARGRNDVTATNIATNITTNIASKIATTRVSAEADHAS